MTDAIESGDEVLLIFVYNREQIDASKNPYHTSNGVQFMVECLEDLDSAIRGLDGGRGSMHMFMVENGNDEAELFSRLSASGSRSGGGRSRNNRGGKGNGINQVTFYWNADITPYARERDARNRETILSSNGNVIECEDYTLFTMNDPETKTAQTGGAYKVFAPFYAKRSALHSKIGNEQISESLLQSVKFVNDFGHGDVKKWKTDKNISDKYVVNPELAQRGGRCLAIRILDTIGSGSFENYEDERNELANERGTTNLSAYIKFGCVSVREVYRRVYDAHGIDHGIIRQLYFRDFYHALAWFHPRVLKGMTAKDKNDKNAPFDERVNERALKWRRIDGEAKADFTAWKTGTTGTPLVDAGMRQLNHTGYMHNRARMTAAMYLTKDLYVDWREGERYFAERLVDYDPINNSAGWQWSASVGSDAAPYFRIMNPYIQQLRFDKDAQYVKRWVPELHSVPAKDVTRWDRADVRAIYTGISYPAPIVQDRRAATERVKSHFKTALVVK